MNEKHPPRRSAAAGSVIVVKYSAGLKEAR
jgi:hypothetical protein